MPPAPLLPPDESEWAQVGAFPTASRGFPTLDEVTRDPMEGELRRLPWQAPVWDAKGFVPGFVRAHAGFWEECILRDHPLRDTLTSYIRDGVDLYDLLLPKFRGESPSLPYNVEHFPQRIFSNHRWPLEFDNFVDAEMQSLLDRGCISRWADVKSSTGPVRPRMIMALSVETSKPRLIYDARPLNSCTRKIPFAMDTVARVASIASSGCYMTSLDDSSAFHHVLLRPSSWPLFGLSYKGVDYCWCVLPFGFSLSPYVYHTLSEAKAAFQRSKGAPSLAYLDDSWRSNFLATYGRPARDQWLAAGEATHVAMLTSLFCGQFLSLKKCELRPVKALQYLGIICDSETMTFRIPQEKLDKLHGLLQTALADGGVSYRTLQRVAGKCMSMTVAIRPASLWTHAMFAVLSAMDKTNQRQIDLTRDAYADLRQEFQKWLSLTASSHEGPWQRASHLIVKIDGSSDASSLGWGGAINIKGAQYRAGGVFPDDWLHKHINKKEMFALYHLLRLFCARFPASLQRAHVLIDVDNTAVCGSFNRGRARDPETHALLVRLFELQVEYEFMLSLKWVPSAANVVADDISRPSREGIIRLNPAAFQALWADMGPFTIDLMASDASAQRIPESDVVLPFFSRYDCEGSSGVDVFAQDVSLRPGSLDRAFGYCFPPPVMAGHVVQHLAECHAHAVIVVPGSRSYWFPRVQQAAVRSLLISPPNAGGYFQWPCPDGSLKEWKYPRWSMVAYEVDFGSCS